MAQVISLTSNLRRKAAHTSADEPRPPVGRFTRPATPPEPRRIVWTKFDTNTTIIIGLWTLITRFVGLNSAVADGTPVFDEKHYVPQAWDMVNSWVNPLIGGIESNPGYGLVVHPPLAKQIEAYGELIFGYTALGWRIMAALFGTATVLLIMSLARQLTGSSVIAAFAGILALFDGVLLITSRFGMLDIFQTLFIVGAAYCLARDYNQMRVRLHQAWLAGGLGTHRFGPRFGFRWWRFGGGVCLGLALSVKWSGLYYMAFFGLMTVLFDVYLRHRYQVKQPILGTLVRDTIAAFCSIVILPIALYAWSWRAWFTSETSIYRHVDTWKDVALNNHDFAPDSWVFRLPEALASWIYYHKSVLAFHASLTTSAGHVHPWDSKPWSWLVSGRPILYYSVTDIHCGESTCRRMIYLFGTPAIWWLTIPIILWSLWRTIIRKDLRLIIPLVSFAAGFLPWLAAYDRQMYFFYATPLIPFTIIMIAIGLGELIPLGKRLKIPAIFHKVGTETTTVGGLIVALYLGLVVAMFVYFSPILYGYTIPDALYETLMWIPSWR